MESWEVLRVATEDVGVKAIAARLKVSTALVYKWCQEPPDEEDPDASGAHNPLDRVRVIYELTRDNRVINWLCNIANGFFVKNPEVRHAVGGQEQLLGVTQAVVHDFGDMLADISRSIANDGQITPQEADVIRQSWEKLKLEAECFVTACERGLYGRPIKHP